MITCSVLNQLLHHWPGSDQAALMDEETEKAKGSEKTCCRGLFAQTMSPLFLLVRSRHEIVYWDYHSLCSRFHDAGQMKTVIVKVGGLVAHVLDETLDKYYR